MTGKDTTNQRLWQIVEPVCASAGYELVDVSLTQSRHGWVLRVFIDHLSTGVAGRSEREGGPDDREGESLVSERSNIGLRDCEQVSRELSAVLDVEDVIAYAYDLEVSSPGLDRPLRKLEHFERFIGHNAKIKLRDGLSGRRNFKGAIAAVTRAAEPTITVSVDGTAHELSYHDIDSAKLVPDWDALFQRRGRGRANSGDDRSRASEDLNEVMDTR